jgi:hypothetical protein
MNSGRQFAVSTLLIALLLLAGCAKKKPPLPSQAKAPIDTIAVPLPDEISEASPPPPAPAPQREAQVQEQPKPKPTTKRKQKKQPQPPATITASAPATPPPAASASSNTLAAAHPPANPAAEAPPDTAIAADVSSAQLTHQKQTTAQLLDATEKTVSNLNRTLSHEEEETVNQIHSYMAQSKNATAAGDFERAYNLATKAHLLSDALVKK